MEKVKVVNKSGRGWMGHDFDGEILSMGPDGSCEMSEKRAEMLGVDYPGQFEIVKPSKNGNGAAEPAEDTPSSDEADDGAPRRSRRKKAS